MATISNASRSNSTREEDTGPLSKPPVKNVTNVSEAQNRTQSSVNTIITTTPDDDRPMTKATFERIAIGPTTVRAIFIDNGDNRLKTTTEKSNLARETHDDANREHEDKEYVQRETNNTGAANDSASKYHAGSRGWRFFGSRDGGNPKAGSRDGGNPGSRVEGSTESPHDGDGDFRWRPFWRRRHRGPEWKKRRCGFGDREPGCLNLVGPNGRNCYGNDTRYDCCETCFNFETTIPDCRYGDRDGNCQSSRCADYSPGKLHDCCDTCHEPGDVMTSPTWMTSDSPTSYSYTSSSPSDPEQVGTPDWVVPVVASAAGVIVVLIAVIVVCFLIRRRRRGKVPDPINEQMYNEYKMSKRAPMAPPRPDVVEDKRARLQRQDTGVYAYINPEDVQTEPIKDKTTLGNRTGTDPLPDRQKDPYTYLQDPDKYGYMEPVGKSSATPGGDPAGPYTVLQGHTQLEGTGDPYTHLHQPRSEEERRRQNSYGQFPLGAQQNKADSSMSERL